MDSIDLNASRVEKFKAIVVCWFLGLGALASWNTLLTILDYYYQIFPNYHPSRVLTLMYPPFSLGTLLILAHNEAKIDTRKRNICGYTIFCLGTLGLLLIDLGTSGRGGIANYIGICILVAAFGVADAHVQGGMAGDLSLMCPEFVQSFFAGVAASGALITALRLFAKAVFEKTDHGLRKGVILFLCITTFLEFLCICLYAFVFGNLQIVKRFRKKAALEGSKTVLADLAVAGVHTNIISGSDNDRLNNKKLLSQNIDYGLDLLLTYLLTISIVPGFLYENTGEHKLGSWYAIVLIAMYAMSDFLGRYIPLVKCIKLESRKGIMIATLLRFFLVPCFYFTAKYGDQGYMMFLVSFLGLTNGYLTVCVMTAAPKGYKAPEQNALGNLLVLFIDGGVLLGVVLDWLWIIGNGKF